MTDLDSRSGGPGIGMLRERSLHAALKAWCTEPGDRTEVLVQGFVVDVLRGEQIIEVQTSGIGSIQNKLKSLAESYDVCVVFPIVAEKVVLTLAEDGETELRRRRSSVRQQWANLFDEFVRCPDLLDHPRLELLAVRVSVTDVRCADGSGSWRRKGVRLVDTRLERVLDTRLFTFSQDLTDLLPATLADTFTHRDLAASLGVRMSTAQRASYVLRKLGYLRSVGRRGHALLLRRATSVPPGDTGS